MRISQTGSVVRVFKSMLDDKCITAFFILLALAGAFLIQTGSALATKVSAKIPEAVYCSNPNPHCYAEVDWYGTTGGAFTNLSPYGALYCEDCVGFIDNEMWFEDGYSSQCINDGYGMCWVEAGIETRGPQASNDCNPGASSVCLFWADARPYGGGFHDHALYYVGPDGTPLDPWYFYVKIRNNDNNSANGSNWSVVVDAYENNSLVADVGGLSTANNMVPADIVIGSELSETSGAADAGENDFQYNQWLDGNGVWHEQTAMATNTSTNPPPDGWWTQYPNSTNGGIWSTDCC